MKRALILAAVAAPLMMSPIAAPLAAQTPTARPAPSDTPPPGLRITAIKACGYRSGSRTLIFPQRYSSAEGRYTAFVEHQGRPANWASLGFSDARQRPWYVNNEEITFRGARYSKYGLPRVPSTTDIVFAGEHDGQAIVTEMGAEDAQLIYVMANGLECEFQPYWRKGS
ncbi:hypothetical protein ACO2Q1_01340 [Brevundimonas sp. VNH65]|uniref:hypothetical protein n=1 Tax=Brevundimonas sp. VNH65 TaxID=3400917 RepID=UPI003C0295CB